MMVLTMEDKLEASLEALVNANAKICGVNEGLLCLEEVYRECWGDLEHLAEDGKEPAPLVDPRVSFVTRYEEALGALME